MIYGQPQIQRQPLSTSQQRPPYLQPPQYQTGQNLPQKPLQYRPPQFNNNSFIQPQANYPTYANKQFISPQVPQYRPQVQFPPQTQGISPINTSFAKAPMQPSFRVPQLSYSGVPQAPNMFPQSPQKPKYEFKPPTLPSNQNQTPNRSYQPVYSPQTQYKPVFQPPPQKYVQQYPPSVGQPQQRQPQPPVYQTRPYQAPQQQNYNDPQKRQENQDLEKQFEDAINKTKQLVSKFQKTDENRNQQPADNMNQQDQYDNFDPDLQDLALQYEDGYIYRGQGIEPSTRQGYGILSDQDENEVYSGFWHDNQYQGQGRLVNFQAEDIQGKFNYTDLNTIENGWKSYEGGFNEGKMNGKGVLYLTNNEKFEGTFQEGSIEGVGSYYSNDGQVIRGLWREGILQEQYQ